MDRSHDPSPFAWIFGGAIALVGLAATVRAVRGGASPRPEVAEAADPPR